MDSVGSAIDRELVRLLIEDGRSSYAELARQVDLGIDAVQQRVQKLVESGQIKIVGSIAPAAFGYRASGMVGLRVHQSAAQVAEAVASHDMVHFVATSAGVFDVVAELVCVDNDAFAQACDRLRMVDGVVSATTMLYLATERFAYTQIGSQGVGRVVPEIAESRTSKALDDNDLAIVNELRRNGRATYAELASAAGLPYSSARRRTVRLVENGLVRINTLITPFLSEDRVMALIGLSINGRLDASLAVLKQMRAVGMITVTTGPYSVLLEVTCGSRADLVGLIGSALPDVPNVRSIEVHQYLSVSKLPPEWTGIALGPRAHQSREGAS